MKKVSLDETYFFLICKNLNQVFFEFWKKPCTFIENF